jgi:multiple antibiotic resistance protein
MVYTLISMAMSLFIVINVIGNIPLYITLLRPYSPQRQRRIYIRELTIGLGILLLFGLFGNHILSLLRIDEPTLNISGGILLFIISLGMIFPKHGNEKPPSHEPMIVPIATPTFAGPGSISMMMVFSANFTSPLEPCLIALLAWVPSIALVLIASNVKNYLGEKGLIAAERFGGMLVSLFSVHMVSKGIIALVKTSF